MSTLSPAQIQERRNAARARWDKAKEASVTAAGAAAGAFASGAATQAGVTAIRRSAVSGKQEALGPLRAAFRTHKINQEFIDRRAKNARQKLSPSNFLSNAPRAYEAKFRMARMANRALARHQDAHSEPFFDSTSGEGGWATDDPEGEYRLTARAMMLNADQADRFKATAADLRAKGKEPEVRDRVAHIKRPKVDRFTREIKGQLKLILSQATRDRLQEMFEHDASPGSEKSVLHDLGIGSIDKLEAHFRALEPQDRNAFATFLKHEASLPNLKLKATKKTTEVTNTIKIVSAGKVTTGGYPKPEARKAMRDELLADIKARHGARTMREAERANEEMTGAKTVAAAADGAITRRLAALFRPVARRNLLIAGAGAGLLAGGAAADRIFKNAHVHKSGLAKAAPDDANQPGENDAPPQKKRKSTSTPRRLLSAAVDIEHDLAAGVGRALAGWKDAVTPDSVASPNAPGGLFDQLDAPLFAGMAPMDKATAEGIAAPSRLQPPPSNDDVDGKPRPRLLQFGFNVRSDAVQDYAKAYRYKRVREITEAQRKNIKQIIVDATNKADPPAVIARKIRDVVGLTAYQASIVANYRTLLETLDPRAMAFALRDKRYDSTITKAIDAKKALSSAQVDKMVDAYQRRMIASRAMTIARTEALRAANNGHIKTVEGFLDDHPEWTVAKTWIATEDDKTRPDHRGLHRQTVLGLNTPFVCDSGERIRWPHDPDAAAKEVVRCRCTIMTTLVPRSHAVRHGPAAYGTPTPNFWDGPKPAYDIDDPDDLFGGSEELEPA